MARSVHVVGSIGMDLVAGLARLPAPGETVTAESFDRVPGGKGANQAVAAARLGHPVAITAAVGDDPEGEQATELLRRAGVDLSCLQRLPGPTGRALINVDAGGETTIVVVPGANAALGADGVPGARVAQADVVISVLEIGDEPIEAAASRATGLYVLNAAPPRTLPAAVARRADLIVVNQLEYQAISGLGNAPAVALTLGSRGAMLLRHGVEVARALPPTVRAVDGTAAGDAFTAAIATCWHADGGPDDDERALRYACAAGAAAATAAGAQPSLPAREEVLALLDGEPETR